MCNSVIGWWRYIYLQNRQISCALLEWSKYRSWAQFEQVSVFTLPQTTQAQAYQRPIFHWGLSCSGTTLCLVWLWRHASLVAMVRWTWWSALCVSYLVSTVTSCPMKWRISWRISTWTSTSPLANPTGELVDVSFVFVVGGKNEYASRTFEFQNSLVPRSSLHPSGAYQ